MATADPASPTVHPGKFVKLPGRAPSFRLRGYGQVQLHLADAFLLQTDVIALREVYSKFAYKDIQAIEIGRTARGAVYNWVLGVLAALFAVAAVLTTEPTGRYVLAGVAAFIGLILLINTVRGPTCRTTVRTVTGQHPLRSLVRVRPARKALALITERIDAIQGVLDQPTAEQEMEKFLARRASRQPHRTGLPTAPTPA